MWYCTYCGRKHLNRKQAYENPFSVGDNDKICDTGLLVAKMLTPYGKVTIKEESKETIVTWLKLLLNLTCAGSDIAYMKLSEDKETVEVQYIGGHTKRINIACDSGIAIIKDVCNQI